MSNAVGFVRVLLFSLSSKKIEKEEEKIGRLWSNFAFIIIFILDLISLIFGRKKYIAYGLASTELQNRT